MVPAIVVGSNRINPLRINAGFESTRHDSDQPTIDSGESSRINPYLTIFPNNIWSYLIWFPQ